VFRGVVAEACRRVRCTVTTSQPETLRPDAKNTGGRASGRPSGPAAVFLFHDRWYPE